MKQREDDPAAKRAYRRMATLIVVLIVAALALLWLWLRQPPPAVQSPTGQLPNVQLNYAQASRIFLRLAPA
jgi:hypothetical protein